jgi:hypothetical protein
MYDFMEWVPSSIWPTASMQPMIVVLELKTLKRVLRSLPIFL